MSTYERVWSEINKAHHRIDKAIAINRDIRKRCIESLKQANQEIKMMLKESE